MNELKLDGSNVKEFALSDQLIKAAANATVIRSCHLCHLI